jgi:N-acetylmuramoyl-L-alanine amidase
MLTGDAINRRLDGFKMFARVSPVFVFIACYSIFAAIAHPSSANLPTATVKRLTQAQFTRAEQQRAALNARPVAKRTLNDYRQVVMSYRRVYLITPRANEVPEALLAVSELYTEMGERFGRSYYQSAVDTYQFLLREYPASRLGPDAMLVCAKLQRDQLDDFSAATKTYQDFLKRYPRSSRKRDAQEAIAELALLQNGSRQSSEKTSDSTPVRTEKSLEIAKAPESTSSQEVSASSFAEMSVPPGSSRLVPRLRRIRTTATPDSTRVTIDLEGAVQYDSDRLPNPDRIFFDLRSARVSPEVARETIQVDGDLLAGVRVAQNHNGVVRIVLDVNGVKDYTASVSENPPQLLIDLYKKTPKGFVKTARSRNKLNEQDDFSDGRMQVKNVAAPTPDSAPPSTRENATASTSLPNPESASNKSVGLSLKTTRSSGNVVRPATAPQPTHDGQSTLTRALGLKIGRIVIDAGHGGHDTGTIGPTGLMEKDLCLDVALRLGKIIKQRLPGAEVVMTRSDDSFIPLEERTAIANQAHADLFISIHANSSQDHGARGIETYYLNLKGSPEAMEVAARENAVSQVGIHDLEDLVKKIARNEKIDESKEFAEDIQNSLSQRVQKTAKTVKNRGVRKAPFVVLIGADMPSILTEISFLSNPADEQLLKKPEHRQRLAEGLYQGVASYLQSLNSMTFNIPKEPPLRSAPQISPASSASSSSALEQSRNHQ